MLPVRPLLGRQQGFQGLLSSSATAAHARQQRHPQRRRARAGGACACFESMRPAVRCVSTARARRKPEANASTKKVPLFEIPNAVLDLDAENNTHVRPYDEHMEAEETARWAGAHASIDALTERLARFDRDAAAALARSNAVAAAPGPWRVLDRDIWSVALLGGGGGVSGGDAGNARTGRNTSRPGAVAAASTALSTALSAVCASLLLPPPQQRRAHGDFFTLLTGQTLLPAGTTRFGTAERQQQQPSFRRALVTAHGSVWSAPPHDRDRYLAALAALGAVRTLWAELHSAGKAAGPATTVDTTLLVTSVDRYAVYAGETAAPTPGSADHGNGREAGGSTVASLEANTETSAAQNQPDKQLSACQLRDLQMMDTYEAAAAAARQPASVLSTVRPEHRFPPAAPTAAADEAIEADVVRAFGKETVDEAMDAIHMLLPSLSPMTRPHQPGNVGGPQEAQRTTQASSSLMPKSKKNKQTQPSISGRSNEYNCTLS
ncbi:methylmalonate-semialdehyde dehydrogenase [Niveomyces insectorum RCEF 264]|uniref:Methylmalonate-semialdehyde dehydrogenase n=1 Tax=Niveomyces insectorum RCEF 264 TaxID=1081102 RepID=A0A167ZWI5_9HYPO|nr:methylmalonate-semialdehyde dehydrogenase [Niveomyces insectorum RCEF 264]